ncbi:MAG: hypothetical protein OQL08_00770, partial [Gammaproteobacteria bacterium]|nr:hypothetical protein [Gammaproteobacteria bacterium]
LPWQPQGPLDARDFQPIEGMHLTLPLWGELLEPLFAPAHLLVGAPDYRIAILSSLLWLLLLLPLILLWRNYRNSRRWWSSLLSSGVSTLTAEGLFVAYLLCALMLDFPGWQLQIDDDRVVADLQTHTLGSHDGFVTAAQNLQWHTERGYDLVAITEHNDPQGGFVAREVAEGDPLNRVAVITAVEVNTEHEEFLLGLGLQHGQPVLSWKENREDYSRRFIADIHQQHDGAVVAMAWKLRPERVQELVASGVDAFEIANTGHPDVPLAVREQLLAAASEAGVLLLASTDWHGWSGLTRTWTVVDLTGAGKMSLRQRATEVVALLQRREAAAFTPVVAGYLGPPSLLRAIFAPVVELARYAAELSPLRLAAWWLWGGLLWLSAGLLRRHGHAPLALLSAILIGGFALALARRGAELLAIEVGGTVLSEDTVLWGERALLVAALALLYAAWLVWRGWRNGGGNRFVR